MHMAQRRMYNTTLDADLIRELKILAAQEGLRQNDLLEEAIRNPWTHPSDNQFARAIYFSSHYFL
jgi:hypothetical protein